MYRSYEDPYKLKEELKAKRAEYSRMMEEGADIDDLIEMDLEIIDLLQRINFAWQDDEYDSEY